MSLTNSSIKVKSKFFNKIKNKIGDVTYQSVVPSVLKNAKFNKKFLKYGKSIKELRDYNKKKKNAIIIGAGPSLRRNNQIKVIKKFANKFIIIACDGSLFYLLSKQTTKRKDTVKRRRIPTSKTKNYTQLLSNLL